jgi:hypothetical protein
MGTILRSEHPEQIDTIDGTEPMLEFRSIIAREGSDLAELLRGRGWVVRSGWRATTDDGDSVWHLRFETPEDTDVTLTNWPA